MKKILLSLLLLPTGMVLAETDFNRDVRPILQKNCLACHGGVKEAAGISFIYRSKATGKGKSGNPTIVPGVPEKSELIYRITTDDLDERMPPSDDHPQALSAKDIATLTAWIKEGAAWSEHWAYNPPINQPLPKTRRTDWAKTGWDAFVLARLEQEGIAPSPEAHPLQWLRRVSLDLTGLPPRTEAVEAFMVDRKTAPDTAYLRAVDRLLASPHFGERWAARWLDLARYADTKGYEKDPHRTIWPYRDWLINAFNQDMPYDQFGIRQLAGDLLPNATAPDLVATAFHRNTQNNTEGGTDDEEYRVAAVIDRVNTTWTVWQGITFGCVQCHSHPYEPFPHESFYRFMDFFNQSEDMDLNDDFPVFALPNNSADYERATEMDKTIAAMRTDLNDAGAALTAQQPWTSLAVQEQSSSHGGLTFDDNKKEFRTTGTQAVASRYTVIAPSQAFTALRVDILPESDDPKDWPEAGSVLSYLTAELQPAEGKPTAITFKEVFADELTGPFDPQDGIKNDRSGPGGYPKLSKPRWAVFVPTKPVPVTEGAKLVVKIQHKASVTGSRAVVLRRFKLSTQKTPAWTELVHHPDRLAQRAEMTKLVGERRKIGSTPVPVMRERPPEAPRETRIFVRGNFMEKDRMVTSGVPGAVAHLATPSAPTRHDMAEWLFDPKNPLTARVAVNRFWAALFGIGLVETEENFGSTGTPPSHPELLDHLAWRFLHEMDWSTKQLLREIVLSATYRQDHRFSPELVKRDPRNRLLARGPRTRLTAEMVRDQALAHAGLLSQKVGGPSVMPPQPDGIWQVVYSGNAWKTAKGEDRYRRGIYTYWRRTSPYPSFLSFDAPSREVCTARRMATNTPLQALVTLNDPVYIECSQAFAKRMAEAGEELEARLRRGFQVAALRPAPDYVINELTTLYTAALQIYRAEPNEAKALAESPEEAALVLVANALLNLDEVLTK